VCAKSDTSACRDPAARRGAPALAAAGLFALDLLVLVLYPFLVDPGVPNAFADITGTLLGLLTSVGEALDFVDELIARPTCRLVRPGPRHLGIFTSLCRDHRASGGFVADAYHAALAIEYGCTWVTYDTDFARFEVLEWRTP
jgi:hypothetical protein